MKFTFRPIINSLRLKFLLFFIGVIIVSIAGTSFVFNDIVFVNYSNFEEMQMERNIDRVFSLLQNEIDSLSITTGDWAQWDDSYAFIQDKNEEYIQSNLLDSTFVQLHLNFILYFDNQMNLVFGKAYDLQLEEEIDLPEEVIHFFSTPTTSFSFAEAGESLNGIVSINNSFALISAQPITDSDEREPVLGTLVMGSLIDDTFIEKLHSLSQTNIELIQIEDSHVSATALKSISVYDENTLFGEMLVMDIFDEPIFALRVIENREIFQRGKENTYTAIGKLVLVSLAIIIISMLFIESTVLARISHLHHEMSEIEKQGLLSKRIQNRGEDEIGRLGKILNQMLEALDKTTKALRTMMNDITSELALKKVLEKILANVITLLDASGGNIGLYDPNKHIIKIMVSKNMGRKHSEIELAIGEGASGTAAQRKESLLIQNYQEWAHRSQQFSKLPIYAAISSPLILRGILIGTICLIKNKPDQHFTDSDVEKLEIFAQQAAIAIENARLYETTQNLAMQDSLTALYNRRAFERIAEKEIQRANRFKYPLCIVMVDIDKFKHINDYYGHAVGDKVIQTIASVCQQNLRAIDSIARLGGDEFMILLPQTSSKAVLEVCERLRLSIQNFGFKENTDYFSVTASLGIAVIDKGEKPVQQEELFKQADIALYAAKKAGRNQVKIFSPSKKV